jgi:NAD(P) transhydrogenase
MRIVYEAGRATAARAESGLEVTLGSGEVLTPEKVIFATGRVGNVEDLGLEAAGVATDERGHIVVDERCQTSGEGIYAAGDVTGPPALASMAMEQGRIAASWAFDLPLRRAAGTSAPFGVYSIPEVAMVGLTEEAAAAVGPEFAVGRATFAGITRAAISGAIEGMLKLVFQRDSLQLLGVHVLGESATELVHLGQAVMHFGGTIEHFINETFNVPTLHEAYKYAAYDGLSAVGR